MGLAYQFVRVPTMRSKAYLAYVKTLRCRHCGRHADDPHHAKFKGLGGIGLTAPDFATMPLCRSCHDLVHQAAHLYPQARWLIDTQNQAFAEGILTVDEDGVRFLVDQHQ